MGVRSAPELDQALSAANDARADLAALDAEVVALRRQIEEIRDTFAVERTGLRREVEALGAARDDAGAALTRGAQGGAGAEPFREAFDRSVMAMAQAALPSRRLLRANASFCALVGRAEAELLGGPGLLDLLLPEDRADAEAAFRNLEEGPGPAAFEARCRHPGGEVLRLRADCIRVEAGTGEAQVFALVQDVTGPRAEAQRQALLARELDHRAKNLLAIMQSIVRLTRAPDLASYRRAIEGRIGAVARAHTLLLGDRVKGAQLRRLVEEELAPYGGGSAERLDLVGPDLPLAADAVQALAMALHELATNAAKYGALSAPGGSLSVSWQLVPAEDLLRLRWVEAGGPPVAQEGRHRGFGSRLVLATIEEQLGGWVVQDWHKAGLRCEIGLPASRSLLPGD